MREGRLEQLRTVLRSLDVRELRFPAEAAARLASLRATVEVRLPDSSVLFTAQAHRV